MKDCEMMKEMNKNDVMSGGLSWAIIQNHICKLDDAHMGESLYNKDKQLWGVGTLHHHHILFHMCT